MFVDANAHLDAYTDDEIDGVLATIEQDRILTVVVSVDAASFARTESIAARSSLVVPAFGVHPWEAPRHADALGDLGELADRSPLIGEIGLDHRFVTDRTQWPAQRRVFSHLLHLAREQDKLVNVHCVGGEHDTSEMLLSHGIERAIIHWYSGPHDVLAEMIAAGFLFTVGVEVLHSDHIRGIARAIPDDQLLTETDNPGGHRWLTGDTGNPSLISDVVAELASTRATSREEVLTTVRANMARLFANDQHLTPWLDQLPR